MHTVTIGGMPMSVLGLGCFGMSGSYGPASWDESIETIRRAVELGVTLFDTADVYGAGHNEVLVGRALHALRDRVHIATKCGMDLSDGAGRRRLRGRRDFVRHACDASLLRLGVDVIDLYYLHRPPEDAEIEETVGAMGELVTEGKVRAVGLCEVDESQLRRAHAVHPVAAVQSEYSLWTRDPEQAIVPALRELGVALVAFSPLGRGFLTGTVQGDLPAGDFRAHNPRFTGAARSANASIVHAVARVADRHGATGAQVALAWLQSRTADLGVPVVAIPGTKRVRWLEQNVRAAALTLTPEDLAELSPLHHAVVGDRYSGREPTLGTHS